MVRIIAGDLKGRVLRIPPGKDFRPTQDRVKESIFGVIQGSLKGGSVCDLFAGSGNLGFEALSRGARCALFVENHPRRIAIIRMNSTRLELSDRVRIIRGDAAGTVLSLGRKGNRFDVIFADPPYRSPGIEALPGLIGEAGLLNDGGIFVLEHPRGLTGDISPGELRLRSMKRFGETGVLIFEG